MTLAPTPGQTIGPFFGDALPFADDHLLVPRDHPRAITLAGLVLDGAGDPVPDALVELWQSDEQGAACRVPGSLHRDGSTFTGWGRAATDPDGRYSFTTLVPGTGFFALTVFARGLLDRLFTRAYLPEQTRETDPLLASLPADRRTTLLARPDAGGRGYRFDIVLQGEAETVFLRYPGTHRG